MCWAVGRMERLVPGHGIADPRHSDRIEGRIGMSCTAGRIATGCIALIDRTAGHIVIAGRTAGRTVIGRTASRIATDRTADHTVPADRIADHTALADHIVTDRTAPADHDYTDHTQHTGHMPAGHTAVTTSNPVHAARTGRTDLSYCWCCCCTVADRIVRTAIATDRTDAARDRTVHGHRNHCTHRTHYAAAVTDRTMKIVESTAESSPLPVVLSLPHWRTAANHHSYSTIRTSLAWVCGLQQGQA